MSNEKKPLSLDVLESHFDDQKDAWVVQDQKSGRYVVAPDPRYPGRQPVRFFLRLEDAQAFADEVQRQNERLRSARLAAHKVKLMPSLRSIAADTDPTHANSFVVHSPNEVFWWLRELPS
jgi:hypothetical protein